MLMTNAWELLLKAKWVADHGDAEESLYVLEVRDGVKQFKLNRSGNPLSISVPFLAGKLLEDKASGFLKPAHDNVLPDRNPRQRRALLQQGPLSRSTNT